jgi:glyoxalase family protein
MITGIHHVALVASDLQRVLPHYTDVLGLRLVEQSGESVHLAMGEARPGSLIRLREQRGAEPGREGVGGSHHFAVLVETRDALLQWKRWLTDHDIRVNGPLDRHYFESIYHRDPDGQVIEIATRGAGWTRDEAADSIGTEHRPPPAEMLKGNAERARILAETWPDPIAQINDAMQLCQMHHVTAIGDDIDRSHAFIAGGLGMRRVKRTSNFDMPDSYHWYWGVGQGEPGTVITYFERKGAAPVRRGPGQLEYYAMAVRDEPALDAARERLHAAGFAVTDIEQHAHYTSFNTRDPHGQTVMLATAGPGFDGNGRRS